MRRIVTFTALSVLILPAAAACDSSTGDGGKTVTVAYQKFGAFTQMDDQMKKVKSQYEAAHPGSTVKLVPIEAAENDYYTKLSLMNRSANTAPDVMYEDTFLVNTDIAAGFLAPIDDHLAKWPDWSQFTDASKTAAKALDGKTYGVPMGTDTRALWYNKDLFAQAGITVPWEPKTWDDILATARTLKAKLPGVIPLNVYSGKAAGEAATMQGLEMLLYGTQDTLYDDAAKKWIGSSPGMLDSLGFIKTIYGEGLAPTPQDALDPNFGSRLSTELLPGGKLAIALDGSWQSGTWLPTGSKPWPQWNTVLGLAAMPTQKGQAPGRTSMSGGWVLSVGSKSKDKQAAFDFVSLALNKDNTLAYDIAASQIAERADVAADPAYLAANPTLKFFTDLVTVTHFRPAYADYPQVSNAIQVAMEAVMTGQQSPQQAVTAFGNQLKQVVGPDKVK
ncbi:extracellular solute-binding protein [Dactylosporangium siamense]|uniref:Sugar ABC transporter substrate-binding protein n=1 Tax=Dactylosporangium siamense TaxID=685454 RepID=A0A919UAD0_9ACTN|nr:extracellular solute-binding protein [Dactylosporangium siamense]GIG47877.1 sugar ABC transporter substrate-binding protein [Dactylosporangium siamense]